LWGGRGRKLGPNIKGQNRKKKYLGAFFRGPMGGEKLTPGRERKRTKAIQSTRVPKTGAVEARRDTCHEGTAGPIKSTQKPEKETGKWKKGPGEGRSKKCTNFGGASPWGGLREGPENQGDRG